MIKIIWNAFLLGIIAIAATWLANNPGAVRVDWLGWRVETSAATAFTLLILLGLIYHYFLSKPVYWAAGIVRHLTQGKALAEKIAAARVRKETEKYALLEKASNALASGDMDAAKKLKRRLERAFASDRHKILPFEASFDEASGNIPHALLLYAQMAENPETSQLGRLGQIRLHRLNNQPELALNLCLPLLDEKIVPQGLMMQAFDMQVELQRWADAVITLEKAYKHESVSKEDYKEIKACLLLEQANGEKDESLKEIIVRNAYDTDENSVEAAVRVAGYDAKKGDVKKARATLKKLWRKTPCMEVYRAYAALNADEPALEQVKLTEKLVEENKETPLNDLVIADVYVAAGLWGQAKTRLDSYMQVVPESKQAYALLARLAEQDKDEEAASKYRDKALSAPDEKPFVCDSCGAVFSDWQNVCPSCKKPAQVRFSL